MDKNKLVKVDLPDSESWQVEINAPVGVTISISVEKIPSPKKSVAADKKNVLAANEAPAATSQPPAVVTLESAVDAQEPSVAASQPAVVTRESSANTIEPALAALESSTNTLEPALAIPMKNGTASELPNKITQKVAAWFRLLAAYFEKKTGPKTQSFLEHFNLSPNILFGAAIVIYLLIRLIGLTDYPGYFSFDEADKTVLASDFLRDGFRNYEGELFPAFFPNPGNNYNVGSVAVYIQLLPLLLFGRSDFVIRFTVVLVGLIGAICVSLSLRDIFRVRYWWAGILLLSVIPAWFHHSRTGYEMPIFASFYSSMLYCYWMYRSNKHNYLYPAVLFSGLAFYSYAPAQAIVPLTVVALLVLDIRYHFRAGRTALAGLLLGIVCVVPYIRFQIAHADNSAAVLSNVGSYWVADLPLKEKITAFLGGYLFHLNPVYWFMPAYDATPTDGLLHIMKGYGHLGLWLMPILFWGLWLLVRRLRQPEYRSLLAVLLIAPVAAALVTSPSSITRALVMVIPVALISSIGLGDLLQKASDRVHLNKYIPISFLLFFILLSVNSYMLWDVLQNGISWFDNNQANGVQFGANKVFTELKKEWELTPNAPAVMSPNWAMMSDMVARIYLGDHANIRFSSLYDYSLRIIPFEPDTIFIATPEELDFAKKDPKFSDIEILKTIPYSASKAGFYFIHLKYSQQAESIIAAEKEEYHKLLTGEILLDGEKVQIAYTRNDGTQIEAAFDEDPVSLYKSAEINPVEFDLTYPREHEFHSIFIIYGADPIELQITFFSAGGEKVKSYTHQFNENGDAGNTFTFDQTIKASKVNISIKALTADENGTVHVWQIKLK